MNASRKSSRRDFLQGKAAIDALGDLADSAATNADDSPSSAAGGSRAGAQRLLLEVGRRAMACQFQIFTPSPEDPEVMEALLQALDCVDCWEERLSVYREQSVISRVNRAAYDAPCQIEPETFQLIEQCVAYYHSTSGAFDITAAPLVRAWGFHVREGRLPSADELQEALARVGCRHLHLDAERHEIRFARPGMELNLGSIGKGFALDQCARGLDAVGIANYLIHGGHSSIMARGSRFPGTDTTGWRVRLRHPLRPDQVLAEIILRDQALGTSGSGRQFFYHQGRRYGHVIDPRNGRPADTVMSSTVIGPSGAQTDALATAFFVMGVDAARAYCRTHPELSVIFVRQGQRRGTTAIELIQMADEAIVLADNCHNSHNAT